VAPPFRELPLRRTDSPAWGVGNVAASPQHIAEVIELFPNGPVASRHGDMEITAYPDGAEVIDLFAGSRSELAQLSTEPEGFGANLADRLTQSQRHSIAQRLIEYMRTDLEARKSWDELTNRALRLLGIDKVDASQLPFPGAAAVQHPILAEACVQFQAHAIEEFFPATGPVKGDLAGEATEETTAQVERAEDFMNYYLTVEDPDYYADTDQMLFYLPIVGSVFRKVWVDPRDGLPKARYVKAEDFIAPYFARDLKNCPRYAHRYAMTGSEIRRAMARGEFSEIDLPQPPTWAEEGDGQSMGDRSDRRTKVLHDDDELYQILEYHVEFALPEGVDEYDDGTVELPYVITVDVHNEEVLSIRRNWRENDPQATKRIWFAHYKFLPGLGFYGWGFLHVIGQLCEAISGGVRAQLDSALLATVQGGFRAKDGAKKAGSITIEPGKWKDIDASIDELHKTFFTPPFKEPSPALTNLIGALIADARRFASITEVLVGQADNKAPVGTTIALIEQSLKLFTAIHKRVFAAAREEFRMLAELIYEFSPYDEYPYYLGGEQKMALRSDFDERVDFIPVADPNIVSSVQRITMAQAVLELIRSDPQLYGMEERVEAHRRFLKALKVPDFESLAPKVPKPLRVDPITENAYAMMGRVIRAFPGQHHQLHIAAHWKQIEIAKNTLPADQFEPVYVSLMAHIREHETLSMLEQVSAQMQATLGIPLPPVDIYGEGEEMPPELEMALTIAAAQALPPTPEPHPASVGAKEQTAEQQSDQEVKDAEAIAKIERDTAAFAAKLKQQEIAHQQKLRQQEELHQAELARMDRESAAQLIRDRLQFRSQLRQSELANKAKLLGELKGERIKRKEREQAKDRKKAPLTRGRGRRAA
jgi:uncharacterized tellurite resistance protein B-like protein